MRIPEHLDWDLLRKFNMCSRHKSFAEAAKESGIQPPAFGNQMKRLETSLGAELFERSNGIMVNSLTSKGSELLRLSLKAEAFFYNKHSNELLQDDNELKIYTTHGIASAILPDILSVFCNLYPHIKVVLLTQLPPKYLSQEESVIRSDFIEQTNVKKVKIMDIDMAFYASENYVKKHGNPKTFQNFKNHRFLFSYGNRELENLRPENIYIEANVTSTNIEFSYKMCLRDQGIIELPTLYPGIDKLVKVLEEVPQAKHKLYLGYIENQKLNSPNLLFLEFIKLRAMQK